MDDGERRAGRSSDITPTELDDFIRIAWNKLTSVFILVEYENRITTRKEVDR